MTPKTPPKTRKKEPELFINRELSWLEFNHRVFEEAADPTVPLLDRLKFAIIVSTNFDEFFMVRVARLQRAIEEGDTAPDAAAAGSRLGAGARDGGRARPHAERRDPARPG